MTQLSGRVYLEEVNRILLMYAQALAGARIQIDCYEDPAWYLNPDMSTTDGATIFLPIFVDRYDSEEENFAWYKVAVTHQAGHIEFGTFDFSLEKAAALFPKKSRQSPPQDDDELTEIERFFDLLDDPKLGNDIFAVAEDVRIDYLLKQEYAGIRNSYQQIRRESLLRRPSLSSLSLKQAFIEVLTWTSLGGKPPVLPATLRDSMESAVEILQGLQSPEATVEDSAEATLRLYNLIDTIPEPKTIPDNRRLFVDQDAMPDFSEFKLTPAEETSTDIDMEPAEQPSEESEIWDNNNAPFSHDDIKRFVNKAIETGEVLRDEYPDAGFFVTDMPSGSHSREVIVDKTEDDKPDTRESLEGELERDGVRSSLYDEWDFRTCCYLPSWCRIRETCLPDGSGSFFKETLARNSALARELHKQFEMLSPQRFKKLTKLQDGEEIDMDAMIEAVVERRAGHTPNEKIYWKRMKMQRDVAVVFLIDMSASTSEVIKETDEKKDTDEDPLKKRPRRRVIDVAKESVVLMVNALEVIGDCYGVYGFSSSGRDNVELQIIKELNEPFSATVERRIDSIRPLFSTRMGPAIRHAIAKLNDIEAATKILFMVSDGYPQDRDYGQDSEDKEYALRDTEMAFVEAKQKHIIPFCLTIDAAGYDFLKEMSHDIDHKVLLSIESLPKHLPSLYRRLTS